MRKILLLTEDNDFFGQSRKAWVPMNAEKIYQELQQYNYAVEKMPFHRLVNSKEMPQDTAILYAFSQKKNVRRYILDTMHLLSKDNMIVPSLDLLMCHEDKGYQELYKRKIGLHSLKNYYFSTPDEIRDFEFDFPIVLKAIDGSNGKEVFLIHDLQELHHILQRHFVKFNFFDKIDYFRRKHFRKFKDPYYPDHSDKLDAEQWKRYITQHRSFVIQEYVADLQYDYRVLVLNGKYYVVKRHNRQEDFRASGAKKFDFDFTPTHKLLDYAKNIFAKADTPFLSIDICEKDGNYYLIEFQALHFGVSVIVKGTGYWQQQAPQDWRFVAQEPVLEREIARSFVAYIQAQGF